MTLGDLLDELRCNVLRDNAELAAGPEDRLWSDETLVRYLNDAQDRFARRTLVLRDNTTPVVVEVELLDGVSAYTLHPSIITVISSYYDTDSIDLQRVGHSLMHHNLHVQQPFFFPSYDGPLTPGRALAFSTDETVDATTKNAVVLTVFPAPSTDIAGKILHLRTARRPLCRFSLDNLDAYCEIPEDYQLEMIEWAAYRAFRTSDIDGHSDMVVACETRFNNAVLEVQKDMRNKLRAPQGWAFGRNGFNIR